MEYGCIWQPHSLYQEGNDFGILLAPAFARDMLASGLSNETYQQMQKLPSTLMGFRDPEPYVFHANTCLLTQVNLSAGDGKWLSLDDVVGDDIADFENPLRYTTHNLDYRASPFDVTTLMGLFEVWVSYSDLLKE